MDEFVDEWRSRERGEGKKWDGVLAEDEAGFSPWRVPAAGGDSCGGLFGLRRLVLVLCGFRLRNAVVIITYRVFSIRDERFSGVIHGSGVGSSPQGGGRLATQHTCGFSTWWVVPPVSVWVFWLSENTRGHLVFSHWRLLLICTKSNVGAATRRTQDPGTALSVGLHPRKCRGRRHFKFAFVLTTQEVSRFSYESVKNVG